MSKSRDKERSDDKQQDADPKPDVVRDLIGLDAAISDAKVKIQALNVGSKIHHINFKIDDPITAVAFIHAVVRNRAASVDAITYKILQQGPSLAPTIVNAIASSKFMADSVLASDYLNVARVCIGYMAPESHGPLKDVFEHVDPKYVKDGFNHFVKSCVEAKVEKNLFRADKMVEYCDNRTLKMAYSAGVVTPYEASQAFAVRKGSYEKLLFLDWFKNEKEVLGHLDLSQVYESSRSSSYDEEDLLLQVLKTVKDARGLDRLKTVYVDRILKSGNVHALSEFVRACPGFQTEEIRAAIVKALSGPPIEDIVNRIMDGRPVDHVGYPLMFHPFYGPMPFPAFPRRGRY